jgi:hypothetical protein
MTLLDRPVVDPAPLTLDALVASVERLLQARKHDPVEPRCWVTSAEVAADLDESSATVVDLLMQLGRAGRLNVRSTHVGLDLQVTGVRVLGGA